MIAKLRDWFDSLAARERRVVLAGAVAAAVLLLFAAVMPLERAVGGARARIERKQADLDWLRQVGPAIASAPPPAATAGNESLIVLVDRSAREAGLGTALTGSQPSGNGGLRAQLQKAEFNRLVAWLGSLGNQYGVVVESANFDAADGPGLVNAVVVVRPR